MLKVWEPFEAMMKPLGTWPTTVPEMAWPMLETWKPALPLTNVEETETELVLTVELPGFAPEEVNVTIEGKVLKVEGKHEEKGEDEGRTFHRFGEFKKVLPVPTNVNSEAIEAKMVNGMLTVVLPKIEPEPVEVKTVEVETPTAG